MSEADWPLLTVEFNSLLSHHMGGITEVGRDALTAFPRSDPHLQFIDLPVSISEGTLLHP
jgi:hypothetical protein